MAHRERVNPELDAAVLPGRVLAFPADRGRVRMSQCRCPWPVGAGHTCGGSRSHRARPPERPGLQRRGRRGSSERRAPPLPHLGQGPGRAYAQAPPTCPQWSVAVVCPNRNRVPVIVGRCVSSVSFLRGKLVPRRGLFMEETRPAFSRVPGVPDVFRAGSCGLSLCPPGPRVLWPGAERFGWRQGTRFHEGDARSLMPHHSGGCPAGTDAAFPVFFILSVSPRLGVLR